MIYINKYPCTVIINDEEGLQVQMQKIKDLKISGININLFEKMVENISNEALPPQYFNQLTLEEWNELYKKVDENIKIEMIEILMDYLRYYYGTYVSKSSNKFQVGYNIKSEKFGLEKIVLKTLEE